MLGSEVVNKHVYYTLRNRPAIQAVIGIPPRITAEPIAADDKKAFPHMVHYAESPTYDASPLTTGDEPYSETIRYVVLFVDQWPNDGRIRPAARDAFHALVVEAAYASGITIEDDPSTYQLNIAAAAEWSQGLGTEVVNGTRYRRKGFYLTVNVFRS